MFWIVVNISEGNESLSRGIKSLPRNSRPQQYYTTEKQANDYAGSLAKESPGKDFAVMKVQRVFSTGTPKLITKICNDQGEMVLEKKDAV
jgi:formylmethanofuran dehydrogenase subunit E